MGINLLDLIKNQAIEAGVSQIGKLVGLDAKDTHSALDGVVPAILGGFLKQSSTPAGLGRLSSTLDQADDTIVQDVLGFLGGDKSQLWDIGKKALGALFGSRANQVTDAVSRSTGVNAPTIGSLFKIAIPLVTAFLARQKKAHKLDDRGLGDLLEAQKPYLQGKIPAEVGNAIGWDDAAATTKAAAHAGGGLLHRMLPLLIIALLVFLGWKMFAGKTQKEAPETPTTTVLSPQDTLVGALKSVEQALTGMSSAGDVQQALPVINKATDDVNALVARLSSFSAAERKVLGGVAKGIPAQLEKWAASAGKIPGASALLAPVLVSFAEAIDKLAANA